MRQPHSRLRLQLKGLLITVQAGTLAAQSCSNISSCNQRMAAFAELLARDSARTFISGINNAIAQNQSTNTIPHGDTDSLGECWDLAACAVSYAGAKRSWLDCPSADSCFHWGDVVVESAAVFPREGKRDWDFSTTGVKRGHVIQFREFKWQADINPLDGSPRSWFSAGHPHHSAVVVGVQPRKLTVVHQNYDGMLHAVMSTLDFSALDGRGEGAFTIFQVVPAVFSAAFADSKCLHSRPSWYEYVEMRSRILAGFSAAAAAVTAATSALSAQASGARSPSDSRSPSDVALGFTVSCATAVFCAIWWCRKPGSEGRRLGSR